MRAFLLISGLGALGLGLLLLPACLFTPDLPGDEGRPCSLEDTCLPGFICEEGLCRPSSLGAPCDLAGTPCAEGFCWSMGTGEAFCTAACASSAECPGGSRCADASPALPGAFVCVPERLLAGEQVGLSGLGAPCDSASECQSGICAAGACGDTCQHARHCEGDPTSSCRVVDVGGRAGARCASPRGGGKQGAVCTASSQCGLGPCVGTGAGGICTEPCCSSADCPTSTSCWIVTWTGWTPDDGLTRTCVPRIASGGAAIGEACSGDLDCASELCFLDPGTRNRACSDLCCTDADCPRSYHCAPQPFDLDGAPGNDSHLPVCVTNP